MAKISVIGCGKVGSAIAFSLLIKGLASEMVLVDYNPKAAEGDALDLLQASCFIHPMDIRGGDYPDTKDSDIVIVTASVPMNDIKSRLDLCQGNVELFKGVIPQIAKASPNASIIMITNPLDIMTYAALKLSGFPSRRVIGTGTMIDSGRFRALIASETRINADELHAYIIGEHGDSQFAALSSANVGGRKFKESLRINELFEQTRKGGYLVMEKKGFTNYAIALSTATLVESILKDLRKIYPVSTLVNNYYGVSDLCISVPCIISREGVARVVEIELNDKEQKAFQDSARTLQDITTSLKF